MKKNAPPAATSASALDREIAERVRSEPETGPPTAGTGAGDMTPVEAALLDTSRDLKSLLRMAGELIAQGRAVESYARLMLADVERLKQASRPCDSRMKEKADE